MRLEKLSDASSTHIRSLPRIYNYCVLQIIFQVKPPTGQTAWILDHLKHGSTDNYDGFIRTLIKTGQVDIVKELLKENPTQFDDASFSANESKGGCQFKGFKLRLTCL